MKEEDKISDANLQQSWEWSAYEQKKQMKEMNEHLADISQSLDKLVALAKKFLTPS
jgi:hypothetical protein